MTGRHSSFQPLPQSYPHLAARFGSFVAESHGGAKTKGTLFCHSVRPDWARKWLDRNIRCTMRVLKQFVWVFLGGCRSLDAGPSSTNGSCCYFLLMIA